MIVHLSEHERFAVRRGLDFLAEHTADLLRPDRKLSDVRHAADLAAGMPALVEAVQTGVLDLDAPGVRAWFAFNHEQAIGVLADCGDEPPDDTDELLEEITLCGRLAVA